MRNALHEQLAERTSRPDWWNDQCLWDVLLPSERRGIDEAKSSLALRGRAAPTADDVVAATSMGLWTGLLSEGRARHPLHNYEGNLWRPRLQKAFPLYNGSRKHLHSQLKELKDIRNRVAHHEPIFKVRLDRIVDMVATIVGYFSHDAERYVREGERVTEVAGRKREFIAEGNAFL
ncbi:hypothetical protein [Curtobacterium ammoniigenes]|uniref:hypothetical protein n=1 Tax=Curtobacterium ammoniigenes TaxID=395387 RepID=UPI00082E2165|nr:hypothetical protein [Curtobacterium ammoniigenes]